MSIFHKVLIIVFLFAIIVWQALHQAHIFKQNKTISHFWKGFWYALAVGAVTIPFISIYDWWYALKIPLLGLCERLSLFDFVLNIARNEKLFYDGNGTTGSIIDKLENKLSSAWLRVLKITYVIIFVITIIFIK